MQTITSPYPKEKGNVLYLRYGNRSGSTANQNMQRMVSNASKKETCGGIYVSASSWQDPPQAPPHLMYL